MRGITWRVHCFRWKVVEATIWTCYENVSLKELVADGTQKAAPLILVSEIMLAKINLH